MKLAVKKLMLCLALFFQSIIICSEHQESKEVQSESVDLQEEDSLESQEGENRLAPPMLFNNASIISNNIQNVIENNTSTLYITSPDEVIIEVGDNTTRSVKDNSKHVNSDDESETFSDAIVQSSGKRDLAAIIDVVFAGIKAAQAINKAAKSSVKGGTNGTIGHSTGGLQFTGAYQLEDGDIGHAAANNVLLYANENVTIIGFDNTTLIGESIDTFGSKKVFIRSMADKNPDTADGDVGVSAANDIDLFANKTTFIRSGISRNSELVDGDVGISSLSDIDTFAGKKIFMRAGVVRDSTVVDGDIDIRGLHDVKLRGNNEIVLQADKIKFIGTLEGISANPNADTVTANNATSPGGTGGDASLVGGAGFTTGTGGDACVVGGTGGDDGNGGDVKISSGSGGATGDDGNVLITTATTQSFPVVGQGDIAVHALNDVIVTSENGDFKVSVDTNSSGTGRAEITSGAAGLSEADMGDICLAAKNNIILKTLNKDVLIKANNDNTFANMGKVNITAGNITPIATGAGEIGIAGTGDINLTSSGDINVEGNAVHVTGSVSMSEVIGNANLSLKGKDAASGNGGDVIMSSGSGSSDGNVEITTATTRSLPATTQGDIAVHALNNLLLTSENGDFKIDGSAAGKVNITSGNIASVATSGGEVGIAATDNVIISANTLGSSSGKLTMRSGNVVPVTSSAGDIGLTAAEKIILKADSIELEAGQFVGFPNLAGDIVISSASGESPGGDIKVAGGTGDSSSTTGGNVEIVGGLGVDAGPHGVVSITTGDVQFDGVGKNPAALSAGGVGIATAHGADSSSSAGENATGEIKLVAGSGGHSINFAGGNGANVMIAAGTGGNSINSGGGNGADVMIAAGDRGAGNGYVDSPTGGRITLSGGTVNGGSITNTAGTGEDGGSIIHTAGDGSSNTGGSIRNIAGGGAINGGSIINIAGQSPSGKGAKLDLGGGTNSGHGVASITTSGLEFGTAPLDLLSLESGDIGIASSNRITLYADKIKFVGTLEGITSTPPTDTVGGNDASSSTGTGGDGTLTGGAGGSTSGNGGAVNVTGGSATNGNGGDATVTAGTGGGAGSGGQGCLLGGAGGGSNGTGGTAKVVGGTGGAINGDGGNVEITGGSGVGTGDNGNVEIKGGTGGSGVGGDVTISVDSDTDGMIKFRTENIELSAFEGGNDITIKTEGAANPAASSLILAGGVCDAGTGGSISLVGGDGGVYDLGSGYNGNGGSIAVKAGQGGSTSGDDGVVSIATSGLEFGTAPLDLLSLESGDIGIASSNRITLYADKIKFVGTLEGITSTPPTDTVGGNDASSSTGTGGDGTLAGGAGGSTSGNGGAVNVTGGSATDGNGGDATVTAGTGGASGSGGQGCLLGGAGGGSNGVGGAVKVIGGTGGVTNGAGGNVEITGGSGVGTGTGGDVFVKGGTSAGSGDDGIVSVTTGGVQFGGTGLNDPDALSEGDIGLAANGSIVMADQYSLVNILAFLHNYMPNLFLNGTIPTLSGSGNGSYSQVGAFDASGVATIGMFDAGTVTLSYNATTKTIDITGTGLDITETQRVFLGGQPVTVATQNSGDQATFRWESSGLFSIEIAVGSGGSLDGETPTLTAWGGNGVQPGSIGTFTSNVSTTSNFGASGITLQLTYDPMADTIVVTNVDNFKDVLSGSSYVANPVSRDGVTSFYIDYGDNGLAEGIDDEVVITFAANGDVEISVSGYIDSGGI